MNTGFLSSKTTLDATDLALGEISGLHGVQGWVKVFSDTQPRENIFDYQPWFLYQGSAGNKKAVKISKWRKQGKTLVAHIEGINDREQARELIGALIAVESNNLPTLDSGEFYWSQLIGLRVKTEATGEPVDLGTVERLIETGANDVLVVSGDENSVDQTERLIPWVPDQFILNVDLHSREICVDWDPAF